MNKVASIFAFILVLFTNVASSNQDALSSDSYDRDEAIAVYSIFESSDFSKYVSDKPVKIESCVEYKYSNCKHVLFYSENGCLKALSAKEECENESCQFIVSSNNQYLLNCE